MLTSLTIRNFVTIETLELDLGPGMSTLTGETGAGKSILVDALGLLLGDKADTSLVRNGCDSAEISGRFSLDEPSTLTWLDENAIASDDDECIIRRVLSANGRSKAFINGTPVTLALLNAFGTLLVNIHGQHAHQSLGSRQTQRKLLDGYASHAKLVTAVEESWKAWRQTSEQILALTAARQERRDQVNLLEFQLKELAALAPLDGEWEKLEQQHKRLSNAQTLITQSEQVSELLFSSQGAEGKLQQALRELEQLCELDPALTESRGIIESALIEVQETSALLGGYADSVELDPQQLADIDERLGLYHSLARKYQCDPEQLATLQQELADKLAGLQHAGEELEALEQQLQAQAASWSVAADKLTKSRNRHARKLETAVTEQIRELAMPKGNFEVSLDPLDTSEPAQHGKESIAFLVAANPGMTAQPISKVASGGELSRISLAIQVVTAGISEVPTLIFDEVDVGIGGGTAEVVGKLLRTIGNGRQVLCVTHLPQVASQAHHHLRVEKLSGDSVTHSMVTPLDANQRIEEIARMLGGVEITEKTRDHAAEMVRLAVSE